MNNKQRGYYQVVYRCANCGNEISQNIKFGSPVPTMMTPAEYKKFVDNKPMLSSFFLEATECSVCGRFNWSDGKVA